MNLHLMVACSPVQSPIKNQYMLNTYSIPKHHPKALYGTLFVTPTDAIAGYQTNNMLYIAKPYQLDAFAHNAWVSPPAGMIYPLIIQNLQQSHLFKAVVSGAYAWKTDYRLDTQLIALQQNYLTKPSQIELITKAVLTDTKQHVLASKVFKEILPCPKDSPWGGVIAANGAAKKMTAQLNQFIQQTLEKN